LASWALGWTTLRRLVARLRLAPAGLVVSVLFVCLSLTPSLLPRTWQAQGIISGLLGSIGYGVGVVTAWLCRPLWRRLSRGWPRPGPRVRAARNGAIWVAMAGLLSVSLYYGSSWQRKLYALVGEPLPGRLGYVRVLLVTGILIAAGIGAVRAIRALTGWTIREAARLVPTIPATIAGVTVVVVFGFVGADAALRIGFPSLASSMAAATNDATSGGDRPSMSPNRSGAPQSLVRWDSLGREGRAFVAGGPTLAQLRAFDGPNVEEPIRVYVGLQSAPTVTAAADLAVRELERTGAASRSVLCVVATTGTGWVDPYAAAALEYVAGGNTATVGTQFSYLPSWISYLTERERVAQATRALFERVYAYWSTLPAQHRPRLLLLGESLGSLGAESAFRGLDDLLAHTDGALFIGPTHANPLWTDLEARRDPGSPQVLPVVGSGRSVRFVSRPQDLDTPTGPWREPRVVYLQNPSDPVTWWSPALLFTRPDWLDEPRGYDVQPAMRWYPVVTFLQVTADLALAQRVTSTHGHYFHGAIVAAWAAIVQPPNWSDATAASLTHRLDQA
jgi:uncharacterized membrane protein